MENRLSFLIFFLLLSLVSCSQRPAEEVTEAIDVAQTLLSSEKCDEAIKLLEDIGRQPKDGVYLQVLSSAYACKAKFRMIEFIADDVPTINTSALFKSVATFSLSPETTVDSVAYSSLKEALNILGGTDFKQATRTNTFGSRRAGDMGLQVLVLSLVQFGKYLNYYGNVDADGDKGQGSGTNTCFLNYTDSMAQSGPVIGVDQLPAANNCNGYTSGHPELSGAKQIERMCEGITLLTNIIDVLENIDISGSDTLEELNNIKANVTTYRTAASTAGVGYFLDLTSPAACRTLLADSTEFNKSQRLFVTLFERELP